MHGVALHTKKEKSVLQKVYWLIRKRIGHYLSPWIKLGLKLALPLHFSVIKASPLYKAYKSL